MYKFIISLFIIIGLFILTKLFIFASYKESDDKLLLQKFTNKYSIFALPKPHNKINFCGEETPLENPDIWERFDKELLKNTYWQSNTLLLHKRANKYFPIIEPILENNNIPNDFKYLALIESGLENVISPAGATGFWQIMKETAKEYGLEVNNEVDERYHIEKSTEAACLFLNAAKEKFGNWTLAAAAYNMGRSGLQKQINRQKVDDYYDLLLNSETSRYIFRILAMKEIIENPKIYGFHFRKKDLYTNIPTYLVSIDSNVSNWADFAQQHKINYKLLKIYNPWLRKSYLTNTKKTTYNIKIPKKGYYNLKENRDTLSIN